ncbi:unnamed protein product [Owenia fusiformis]|uniref:Uncharacterized protein n=1 Tax=Owenia fusiformis TaxID=6347 RepID=A0A8J1Y871_OWEFU|nr:unnamed protein product [Owenia fusiformis]
MEIIRVYSGFNYLFVLWIYINLNQEGAAGKPNEQVRMCYFTNWSQYRPGEAKFLPENIDPHLCTHILYAFAKLSDSDYTMKPFEWNDLSTEWSKGMLERVVGLKKLNPKVKVLVSLGGWNMGSKQFSAMVATRRRRERFIKSVIEFILQTKTDGMDLDWEYPATRGSPLHDKEKYTSLVKELRRAFDDVDREEKLILAAAIPGSKLILESAYDLTEVSRYYDMMIAMCYDLHGSWEWFAGHHSPVFPHSNEKGIQRTLNMHWVVNYLLEFIPREKLVLGVATYGRSMTLRSEDKHNLGHRTVKPGSAGAFTNSPGVLAYYEICKLFANDGWNNVWSDDHAVPYAYKGTQWVGYDDIDSITIKGILARTYNLGGVAVWSLDLDDFQGDCHGTKYPLINQLKTVLEHDSLGNDDIIDDLSQKIKGNYLVKLNMERMMSEPDSKSLTHVLESSGMGKNYILDKEQPKGGIDDNSTTTEVFESVVTTVIPTRNVATNGTADALNDVHSFGASIHGNTFVHSGHRQILTTIRILDDDDDIINSDEFFQQIDQINFVDVNKGTIGRRVKREDGQKCSFPGVVKDPNNCHKYFQCFDNKLFNYNCGPEFVFDPRIQTCSYPSTVEGCAPETSISDQDGSQDQFICKTDGYFANPDDCNRFYRCVSGRVYQLSCTNGLFFNERSNSCDYPRNVDCKTKPANTHTVQQEDIVTQDEEKQADQDQHADDQAQNRYGEGSDQALNIYGERPGQSQDRYRGDSDKDQGGRMYIRHPESRGEESNHGDGDIKDWTQDRVEPPIRDLDNFVCPGTGYFPSLNDCSAFYHCDNNIGHKLRCNGGLVFNIHEETCDWPANVPECDSAHAPPVAPNNEGEFYKPGVRDDSNPDRLNQNRIPNRNSPIYPDQSNQHQIRPDYSGQDRSNGMNEEYQEYDTYSDYDNNGYDNRDTFPESTEDGSNGDAVTSTNNVESDRTSRISTDGDIPEYQEEEPPNMIDSDNMQEPRPIPQPKTDADAECYNGFLRDKGDCTTFYVCENGNRYRFSCPDNLAFSILHGHCVDPSRVPGCEYQSGINTDMKCSGTGYFRDRHDCRKYYECINGTAHAMFCKFGYVYSKQQGACDFIYKVPECTSTGILPSNDPTIPSQNILTSIFTTKRGSVTDEENATFTTSPANVEDVSEIKTDFGDDKADLDIESALREMHRCDEDGYTKDEEDCSVYYICAHGIRYRMECLDGHVYNSKTQQCDSAYNVPECLPNDINREKLTEQHSENPNTLERLSEPVDAIKKALLGLGKEDCNTGDTYRHPKQCGKFYACVTNFRYELQCPKGYYFNPSIEQCDIMENVLDCVNGTWNNTEPVELDDQPDDPRQNGTVESQLVCPFDGYFRDARNCSIFYECLNGNLLAMTCPHGLVYNSDIHACDFVWNSADCDTETYLGMLDDDADAVAKVNNSNELESNDTHDFQCPHDGVFRDPTNCSVFYECILSTRIRHECPAGLLFSNRIYMCDHPDRVECNISLDHELMTGVKAIEGTEYDSAVDTSRNTTDDLGNTHTIDNPKEDPDSNERSLCMDTMRIAFRGSCNMFLQCINETVTSLKKCPRDTYFNATSLLCQPGNCEDYISERSDMSSGDTANGNITNGENSTDKPDGYSNNKENIVEETNIDNLDFQIDETVNTNRTHEAMDSTTTDYDVLSTEKANGFDNEKQDNYNDDDEITIIAEVISTERNECTTEGSLEVSEDCHRFSVCLHGFVLNLECQNGFVFS